MASHFHSDDESYEFKKEDPEELMRRKRARHAIEAQMERKRLRADIKDDLDDEDNFDWSEIDNQLKR